MKICKRMTAFLLIVTLSVSLSTTTAAATKKTYSDVTKDNWFYDYVMSLSESGVISGNPDGTFAPERTTTVGETLKLVLLATGNPEQKGSDDSWASGYAAYARAKGYLKDADLEDLNDTMPRLTVARFAAKALWLDPSENATPFTDIDDGYVTALYEKGIITGSLDDGVVSFKPDAGIKRSEISAIIYRIDQLAESKSKETINYNSYTINKLDGVPTNQYVKSAFSKVDSVMTYNAGETLLGVDVSKFQGTVDWQKVKDSGVDFAMLRVGGRYTTKDEERDFTKSPLYDDTMFEQNVKDAVAAGLIVGVYFYSQAITVEEAEEEAQFVLDRIKGHGILGPVVYDWETTGSKNSRTYGMYTKTLCDCANTFCTAVKEAGYSPMVYFASYDGYMKYDLSKIMEYDFWYADYGSTPEFYYNFKMWQYTSKGHVDGIDGKVDMDLWFK